MTTTGDLGSLAYNRLANVPATITVNSITEYIDYGKIDIENYLGVSIDTTNVPTRYQNILISVGCMYTLLYMLGANADFDTEFGEFKLRKVDRTAPEFRELEFFKAHLNETLKVLGTQGGFQFTKVYGV